MGKLKDKIQGEVKKEDHGPYIEWWPNPFSRQAVDMPLEMILEEREKWCKAGRCPGCGKEVKRNPDGRLQCTNCPLCITEEIVEKYGDHWK